MPNSLIEKYLEEIEYKGKNGLIVKNYDGAYHVLDKKGKKLKDSTFWTLASAKIRADKGK